MNTLQNEYDVILREAEEYAFKETDFKMELLDINKFVKVNNVQEISNPVFFVRRDVPTSDGLLSNEIFGITKQERSNIYGYVNLGEKFIHPFYYKVWCSLDSKIKEVVHGTDTFIIDSEGQLQKDPNGKNGIKFLYDNFSKIKIKASSSLRRDLKLQFFEAYRNKRDIVFIDKYIVLPAYYRDVNTEGGKIGVGEINSLYRNLIIAVKSLRGSADFGLSLSAATRGRIEEILLQIYNWFGMGTTISGKPTTNVIPGKTGVLRNAVLNKTTDYSSRLVISAPQLKVNKITDLQADMDHVVLPLASALVNFLPYNIFFIRRYFENLFSGEATVPVLVYDDNPATSVIDAARNVSDAVVSKATSYREVRLHVKDYQTQFSDAVIQKQIDRFLKGYSNRFIPITIEMDNPVDKNRPILYTLAFKGHNVTKEQYEKGNIGKPNVIRAFTWCDLLYMAAVESTRDKHVLITRYPLDTCYNIFPSRARVSSTKDTEPMVFNLFGKDNFYPNYPKIRPKDILSNTSNKFVDTLNICNLYLAPIGGDYDGDQVTVKGIFGEQANDELEKFMNSKAHLVGQGGKGLLENSKEALMCAYSLTMSLSSDKSKFTNPVFK